MIGRCLDEDEVACEQRPRLRIEHGQVAIRVRRRPRLQFEGPPAEIERQTIAHGQGWRNEFHLVDELVADDPAKRLEVEFAAHRQGSRQIVVADKGRANSIKGGVAKDVIRMLVGIDDIEDGFVSASADGGEQPLADRHAAAGVDDRHTLVADHEADIGDIARFSSLIKAISPVWTNTPGATSWTGNGDGVSAAGCALATEKARMAMRAPMSQRMFQFDISESSIPAELAPGNGLTRCRPQWDGVAIARTSSGS